MTRVTHLVILYKLLIITIIIIIQTNTHTHTHETPYNTIYKTLYIVYVTILNTHATKPQKT